MSTQSKPQKAEFLSQIPDRSVGLQQKVLCILIQRLSEIKIALDVKIDTQELKIDLSMNKCAD